eukprot:scaffold54335_cov25-Phaeocystis_antarctica.AAC.1
MSHHTSDEVTMWRRPRGGRGGRAVVAMTDAPAPPADSQPEFHRQGDILSAHNALQVRLKPAELSSPPKTRPMRDPRSRELTGDHLHVDRCPRWWHGSKDNSW